MELDEIPLELKLHVLSLLKGPALFEMKNTAKFWHHLIMERMLKYTVILSQKGRYPSRVESRTSFLLRYQTALETLNTLPRLDCLIISTIGESLAQIVLSKVPSTLKELELILSYGTAKISIFPIPAGLKSLKLSYVRAQRIEGGDDLQNLYLENCGITTGALKSLTSLKNLSVIDSLDLLDNPNPWRGLLVPPNVEHLTLQNTGVIRHCQVRLPRNFRNLEHLRVLKLERIRSTGKVFFSPNISVLTMNHVEGEYFAKAKEVVLNLDQDLATIHLEEGVTKVSIWYRRSDNLPTKLPFTLKKLVALILRDDPFDVDFSREASLHPNVDFSAKLE
eukprot:TRINITY_DN17479_c0_g1_i1.p1 TRINITY_DN17479_c0_g1~~TRINITY_DN17479_c0_g1_i1.p1  ORF type:complete len:347 (-),score=43.62 TRINITY_DN17479_c0_g1_i1:15-1019(-)